MIPPVRSLPGAQVKVSEPVVLKLRKVLVVDEALPIRRSLLDALHKMGIPAQDVVSVSSADDVLETFVRVKPTLVFTEFVGDRLEDGRALICEMLSLDPHVKIVLVTSESRDSPHVRMAIRCGAFAHVEKPLRHEKIRNVLSEMEAEAGGIERYR